MNKLVSFSTVVSIFCLAATLFGSNAYSYNLPFSWAVGSINESSLANKEQLKELLATVMEEISSRRNNEESIVILNQKLQMLQLPLIQANPKVSIVGGNGFAGSKEGATITDSHHRFCLPCKVGWNQYEFGIIQLPVKPVE